MNNTYDAPPKRGRMARWSIGITLAGFVAGGAFAAVAASGNSAPTVSAASADASNSELNTLLSASSATGAPGTTPASRRLGSLRRLRGAGGYYGSITFRGGTLSFERGTIESVSQTNMVVRALDGTTMTWQLVANTVVHDHGRASISALSDGQLVFVGGPVAGGAKDARLIVVRTSASAPSAGTSAGTSAGNSAGNSAGTSAVS